MGSVQDFILLFLWLVWIKRIRRQGDSRFPCVTPVVETFSSDRITFRIPSNINYGAPVWKLPTGLARWLFPQKCSTTDLRQDSKCRSVKRCCKFGVRVDCKCMEFVAAGWCTRKWLRFHQTIRNLTSGDLGVLLLVIRLGLTGLKKTRVVYLLDLLEGVGEKGQCDLVRVERL